MQGLACTDVNIKWDDINDATECKAGALFLALIWKRLTAKGATLTDGSKETLTLIYLTHQLGASGGPALFKVLDDGKGATTPASPAMVNNIAEGVLA